MIVRLFKSLTNNGWYITYHRILFYFNKPKVISLDKQFTKVMSKKKWKEATQHGENLIRKYPAYSNFYKKLALCYYRLGQKKKSVETMQKALEIRVYMSMKQIEKLVNARKNLGPFVSSQYLYLSGHQNYGFFKQIYLDGNHEKEYLTKICDQNVFMREFDLYQKISSRYPELTDIAPKIYSIYEIGDLSFVVMENINGKKPTMKHIQKMISFDRIITSIKYKDIADLFPPLHFHQPFIFSEKSIVTTLDSFVSINQERFHVELFHALKNGEKFAEQISIINRMEEITLNNRLYEYLSVETHYSLQHGDFKEYNMLVNKNGRLYLYDWGRMKVGPSWIGSLGLLLNQDISFRFIQENYLISPHLQPIEKLFFVYTWIACMLLLMDTSTEDIEIAVRYMEEIAQEFTAPQQQVEKLLEA